jgi:putative DNA primase/helicase
MSATLDDVRRIFDDVRRSSSGGVLVRCPCHNDQNPSLSFWIDESGNLAHDCKGGCRWSDVHAKLECLGLYVAKDTARGSDGNPARYTDKKTGQQLPIVEVYDYPESGPTYRYSVGRTPKSCDGEKNFPVWRRKAMGGFEWGRGDVPPCLYHGARLQIAVAAAETVVLGEGEKDVHTAERLGFCATTNSNGAKQWKSEFAAQLEGTGLVVILNDNDDEGRRRGDRVAADLAQVGVPHVILNLPGLPDKGDVSDWVEAGGTREQLLELIRHAQEAAAEVSPAGETVETQSLHPRFYTGPELTEMEFANPNPVLLYAEPGCLFDLVSPSKVGKTSLALQGCKAVLDSELFLELPTQPLPILYLTEQTRRSFRDKLTAVGTLPFCDDFHMLFIADCMGMSWVDICAEVREAVRRWGIGILIVDTLTDWAGMENENDNAEAICVMRPLRAIAQESNTAVITIRHTGKGHRGDGDVVDAGRGASAFVGVVDTTCELSRVPGQGHPNRRQLRFSSRKDGIPESLVIELRDNHYVALGDALNVEYRAARRLALEQVPCGEANAVMLKELHKICGEGISEATLERALGKEDDPEGGRKASGLVGDGLVLRRKGAGSASTKAYGYWRPQDDDRDCEKPEVSDEI